MSKIETPEQLAQLFHETYERLAPDHGYETRKASAKPWSEVPPPNRDLMIATCDVVLAHLRPFTLADVQAAAKVLREAPTLVHGDGYVYLDGEGCPIVPPDVDEMTEADIDDEEARAHEGPPMVGGWGILSHEMIDGEPVWDGCRPTAWRVTKSKAEAAARQMGAAWIAPIVAREGGWSTGDAHRVEGVAGYAHDVELTDDMQPLPANRLLVEFTLPDDTRDAADEVLKFLADAEQLGATPDGLGWRDADIGELRIWTEGLEPEPEGVTSLYSTFKVRDDLGRELDVAGLAWGSGLDVVDARMFETVAPPDTYKIPEPAIVSKKPIDASKTYLVFVVEHPDEAIRG